MKIIIKYILTISLLWPLSALSQVFDIQNYSKSDYLGREEFFEFTQDDNLILYFASNQGVITYDGLDFSELEIAREIDTEKIENIIFFKNNLYISVNKILYKYDLDSKSLIIIEKKPSSKLKLYNNSLYFTSDKSIYNLKPGDDKAQLIYQDDKDILSDVFINDKLTIAGSSKGLKFINNGKLIEEKGSFIDVKNIIPSNDSSLIILSDNALFNYTITDNLKDGKISRKLLLKNEKINHLFQSKIGTNYLSTNKGNLYYYDGIFDDITLNPVKENNGLKSFHISNIGIDKELNLWLLGKDGLSKIAISQPFVQLNQNEIHSIFKNENSVLIVKNKKLEIFNFSYVPKVYYIPEKIQDASAIYINREWWLIINNEHFYKINPVTAKKEAVPQKLSFVKLLDGNTFLAKNENGEILQYNDQFQVINNYNELEKNAETFMSSNKLKVLSQDKVYTIDDKGTISLTNINFKNTGSLDELKGSNFGLWSFSKNTLRLHMDDGSINDFSFILKDKQVNHIYNIFEDSQHNLWLSINKGLAKISFSLNNNQLTFNEFNIYGALDHVADSYFNSSIELANQQIWFVNDNSITIYNPLLDNPQLVAPGLNIKSSYAINYDEFYSPLDTVILSKYPSKINYNHEIIIDANIISHYKNHKSQIRYRNVSDENVWKTINTNEKIKITNLLDGENKIEIQSVSPSGVSNENDYTYTVIVNPPIWKKDWFYVGSVLSLLLLGFVGYKSFVSFKDGKTKELNEKLDSKLEDLERKSHLQILKSERLKQLNELITSQKGELEKKNKQIESQKYELSLTNDQIKKQKDLLEETGNKLKASINYAQRIQNALMSTEVEVKKAIDDSYIYFLPRDVVSGDFYWFNKVINERGEELFILSAVDCTGHGVPGAIVSVMGINLLNNITNLKKIYDPGKILNELNKDIIDNLRQNETQVNDGMDMSLVTINYTTKTVKFAGAKNPLIHIEDGELIRTRGDKHAIGGQQRGEERDFKTHTIDCNDGKNRFFYLFSDGYQDQFGGDKGFKFLTSNFKKLLLEIYHLPVLEQKTILHEQLEDWMGEYPQTDDVLVIGFKF